MTDFNLLAISTVSAGVGFGAMALSLIFGGYLSVRASKVLYPDNVSLLLYNVMGGGMVSMVFAIALMAGAWEGAWGGAIQMLLGALVGVLLTGVIGLFGWLVGPPPETGRVREFFTLLFAKAWIFAVLGALGSIIVAPLWLR
jgi:hypothetical protein